MKWCGFINKYSAMQVLFGHGVPRLFHLSLDKGT